MHKVVRNLSNPVHTRPARVSANSQKINVTQINVFLRNILIESYKTHTSKGYQKN
jgi:hypothetical protein